MTDFHETLQRLKRPGLLIRAARHGLAEYDRSRDLRRLLGNGSASPGTAMPRLVEAEDALERERRSGSAGYSVARHVDVLIAMIAELRLINRHQAV